jgi:protein-disulfide isomerase
MKLRGRNIQETGASEGLRMKIAATFLLAAFALTAQTTTPPKSALDKATLEAYLRYAELWIPQVTVKIDDPKPSTKLDGFYEVSVHLTFNGATKDESYYVSKDGKNVVKGEAYDVRSSPFQSNLDLLKIDGHPSYGAGAGASVNLVVFSDFQCPYCQKEELDLRKNIPAAFGDKVRVTFVDFPLTSIHPWAMKGSIAGRCTYRVNPAAFWDYHDWVYTNQKDITLENFDAKFQEYAKSKGLDTLQLGRCMDDKASAAEVDKSVELGHQLGISAAPTLFINGRRLEGGVEWSVLQQLLQIEIDHTTAETKTVASTAPKKEDDSCCTVEIPKVGAKK